MWEERWEVQEEESYEVAISRGNKTVKDKGQDPKKDLRGNLKRGKMKR